MSRIASVVAIVFLAIYAAPVAAEPLVFSRSHSGSSNGATPPATLMVGLWAGSGVNYSLITSAGIPNVIHTSTPLSWTIDASNATEYGFDWTAAQSSFDGSNVHKLSISFNNINGSLGSFFTIPSNGDHLAWFVMDRLEVDLVRWRSTTNVQVDWRLHGDGLVVPEPSTVMGFLALLFVIPSRTRLASSRVGHLRSRTHRPGKSA